MASMQMAHSAPGLVGMTAAAELQEEPMVLSF
jgi:hypothetical protein